MKTFCNYFRKLSLLLFIAAFSSSAAQELNCTFFYTPYNEYACRLQGITTLDRSANRTIIGNHLENMTNVDVEVVQIYLSDTPFMIPEVFVVFEHISELEYYGTTLQNIEIPASARLLFLILDSNNITRIGSGNIQNQTSLFVFEAFDNNIQEIAEDAFVGIPNVYYFVLVGNPIEELPFNLFQTLPYVIYVDLESNRLRVIDEDLFSENFYLSILYLENNQINEISPRFVQSINNFVNRIDLTNNLCVSRNFLVGDEFGRSALSNGLHNCFQNFEGNATETRRITLEFQGPLALFDQFGNLIFRT